MQMNPSCSWERLSEPEVLLLPGTDSGNMGRLQGLGPLGLGGLGGQNGVGVGLTLRVSSTPAALAWNTVGMAEAKIGTGLREVAVNLNTTVLTWVTLVFVTVLLLCCGGHGGLALPWVEPRHPSGLAC